MAVKLSRLETRIPRWWEALTGFCEANEIRDHAYDELFALILAAINEDKAVEMGFLGGIKGGVARAAALTLEERSASAAKAARARWRRRV